MEGTLCTKPGTGSSRSQIFWMADHLSSQLLIIDFIHVDTGSFCLSIPTWLPLRTHLPLPPSPHYLGWMSSSPGLQGYTHELAKPPHPLATVGRVRIQIIPVRLTPKNCEEDGSKSCWGYQVERTYLRKKLPRVKHFWGKRRKKDRRAETELWWHCFWGSGSRLPWGSPRYESKDTLLWSHIQEEVSSVTRQESLMPVLHLPH